MKAFLMYKDQDFDLQRQLPSNELPARLAARYQNPFGKRIAASRVVSDPIQRNEQALTQDLELNTLFNAMALGDDFLFEVAKKAILPGLSDLDTIRYRQNILEDCLKNPSIVRDIYQIPIESIENKKSNGWAFSAVIQAGYYLAR